MPDEPKKFLVVCMKPKLIHIPADALESIEPLASPVEKEAARVLRQRLEEDATLQAFGMSRAAVDFHRAGQKFHEAISKISFKPEE